MNRYLAIIAFALIESLGISASLSASAPGAVCLPSDKAENWRRSHAGNEFVVLPASSMEKFLPEDIPADADERLTTKDVIVHCARNESESVQMLLVNCSDVSVSVTVELSGEMDGIETELYRVGRVRIERPSSNGCNRPGMWPDPLFPLESACDVPPDSLESIWITFHAPLGVSPGLREMTLAVKAGDVEQVIHIKVDVSRVTLPRIPVLQTFIYAYDGCPFYPDWATWKQAEQTIVRLARKNRFQFGGLPVPDGIDTDDVDWTVLDNCIEDGFAEGLNIWLAPKLQVPGDMEATTARYGKLERHLAEKGWLDYVFVWDFDEPQQEQFKALGEYCRAVHKAAPGLRILLTQNHSPYFDNCNMIWCPANTWLDDAGRMAAIRERLENGDGTFWTYNCENTRTTPHPDSWRIDAPGTRHRALGVMLWKFKATGYLYWNISYWCNYSLNSNWENYIQNGKTDIFNNPSVIGYGQDNVPRNGDGFLLYPDPDGKKMPIPSMRLEINRDAFEDYELLALVRARHGHIETFNAIIDRIMPRSDTYSNSPADYNSLHDRLIKELEKTF